MKRGNGDMRLPDVHIIGAGKSGSSSLFAYLAQHPEIYTPGPPEGRWKEPRTLLYLDGIPRNPPSDLNVIDFNEYLEMWRPAGNRKALEGSIIYMLYHDIVIPNIKKLYADPEKVFYIAILRDPVERAFSHYKVRVLGDQEDLSFREAVRPETIRKRLASGGPSDQDYISQGMYYEQIKAFMNSFPNVRVYLLNDLVRDAQGVIDDICDFVGIDRFTPSFERHNVTQGVPKSRAVESLTSSRDVLSSKIPLLKLIPLPLRAAPFRLLDYLNRKEVRRDEEAMAELRAHFRDDILRLQDLLGRDLSHWLYLSETSPMPSQGRQRRGFASLAMTARRTSRECVAKARQARRNEGASRDKSRGLRDTPPPPCSK